jgi:hypothetical protein
MCQAPHKVSHHTAHCREAHTTAESHIVPCVEDILSYVIRNKCLKIMKEIFNLQLWRIEDIGFNI